MGFMKAKTASPETAVLAAERKLHKHMGSSIKTAFRRFTCCSCCLPWCWTLVFKHAPMGGVLIAFREVQSFKGIWGSELQASKILTDSCPRRTSSAI